MLGSQAELVLAHSDCAVEIVGNGSSANFVLLASVGNRPEENSSIERSLEREVAILTLHCTGDLVTVLFERPLLAQDAVNRAVDRDAPISSHFGNRVRH